MLAFTGRYPARIFDFVLGMNRWALRVAAYAGLMTDEYPPFRLDMGGHDPIGTVTLTPSSGESPGEAPTPPRSMQRRRGWTAGRVVSLVLGSVLGLASLGLLTGGGIATWVTNTQRDAAGYISTHTNTFATS